MNMTKMLLLMARLAIVANLWISAPAQAQKFAELAQTPPLGWNSWNKFGCHVSETLIRETADAMLSSGLRDAGYQYVNIDDCWQGERDAQGNIEPDAKRFPSGIKALADYVHARGLKLGIYSDAGAKTCGGYPGSRGHEYQDARSYAAWGVDYLKYDWCNTEGMDAASSYATMRDALHAAGRPVLFSICEWGSSKPWEWAPKVGHSWRTTGDIHACWNCEIGHGNWASQGVLKILDAQTPLRKYAAAGQWNDMDMLEVGNGMSEAEDHAHFTLWSMMNSPLIAGNDLRNMSESVRKTLTQREVIALGQDPLGIPAFRALADGDVEVWAKPLANGDWAVAFLNRGDQPRSRSVHWKDLVIGDGLSNRNLDPDATYQWKELWSQVQGSTAQDLQQRIAPHSLLVYRLVPAAGAKPKELVLFGVGADPSLQVWVADFEARTQLADSPAVVPKPSNPRVPASAVSARRSTREGERDVLTLQWTDAWSASLRLEAGKPLDLRPFLKDGTLEFDLNVLEMARGGLTFTVSCGEGCTRKLPYVLASRALQGKGWQHMAFALSCFVRQGDDFGAVTQPFALESSGSGEAALANVRLLQSGTANAACPDYRVESVTPAPLTQVWALEWWMKRHQSKLDEIGKLKQAGLRSDLVFIGDSITHGWEDAGRKVWDEHFAPRHALDLGFGGDHTENVLWRLQHGELDGIDPKVAVLMIGTNNTGDRQEDPRTTAAGIRHLLDELRQRLPQTRVLLLAIFPRDPQAHSPLRLLNDRINGLISGFADGEQVVFLNINETLMGPQGELSADILPDWLHLSEQGYGLWARAIEPTLKRLMTQAPVQP